MISYRWIAIAAAIALASCSHRGKRPAWANEPVAPAADPANLEVAWAETKAQDLLTSEPWQGDWQRGCSTPHGKEPQIERLVLSKDQLVLERKVFLDTRCDTPLAVTRFEGTLKALQRLPAPGEFLTISIEFTAATMTVDDPRQVEAYNKGSGHLGQRWKRNAPVDVLGRDRYPVAGHTYAFTLLRDGDWLWVGDFEDRPGLHPNGRGAVERLFQREGTKTTPRLGYPYARDAGLLRGEAGVWTATSGKIDALLAGFRGAEAAGVAVLVTQRGQVTYRRTTGYENLILGTRVSGQSLFPLGSASEALTAQVVATAIAEGKLVPHGRIADSLTPWPKALDGLTWEALLHHHSSLPTDLPMVAAGRLDRPRAQDLLKWLASGATAGRPGLPAALNYVALAEAMTQRRGQSWPEIVRETVLTPLGMHHTLVDDGRGELLPHARPYLWDSVLARWQPAGPINDSGLIGTTGIYTSLDDLALWFQGWHRGTVTRVSQQTAMWPINPGPPVFRWGWVVTRFGGLHGTEREAIMPGSYAYVARIPQLRIGIAVLANRSDVEMLRRFRYALVDILVRHP